MVRSAHESEVTEDPELQAFSGDIQAFWAENSVKLEKSRNSATSLVPRMTH